MNNKINLVLVLILFLNNSNLLAQSNIDKIEYYVDADPGVGLANNIPITPNQNIANLVIPINPNLLTSGLHNVHIRARDANGNWSLQNSTLLFKPYNLSGSAIPLPNITKLEYYIDNDPGIGMANNIPITPDQNIANLVIPINPNLLTSGLHNVHIRARDANGNWSLQNSTLLFKPYNLSGSAIPLPNITKLEYYIDNDPGIGMANNVPITPNQNIANVVIPINPNVLTSGIHNIHIRVRDANGNWSLQNSTLLFKPYNLSGSAIPLPNITKLEYYMDNDPGIGMANNIPITPNQNIANLVIPINPNLLTSGLHNFHIRARDANGNWSLQNSTLVFKPYNLSGNAIPLPNITKLEYFFDIDPGLGQGASLPITPSTDISSLVFPLNPFSLIIGPHTLHVRALDANSNWSLMNKIDFIVPDGIYVKLFIQGYYAGNNAMTNVLSNQGIQNYYSDAVDSVDVELHDETYPYNLAYSYKGILLDDGILPCVFPSSALNNHYYIAIKHRNSLQTWSNTPILLSQTTHYDFTDSATKAYGDNLIEIEPGIFAIYSGELNQDDNIDLLDALIAETDINNFAFGYFATDINGDGNVDLLDSPLIEASISNFIFSIHP